MCDKAGLDDLSNPNTSCIINLMRILTHTAGLVIFGLLLPSIIFGAPNSIDIFGAFVSRSTNSATISWNTSPHTKGYISYAGPDGVWKNTPWSQDYLAKHEITILQLEPDTTYLYRINGENSDGQYQTSAGTFSTLSPLGQTNTTTNENTASGSFQAILSPSPTPTIGMQNPQGFNPNIQYIPYAVPFQVAISQAPIEPTINPVLGAFDTTTTSTTSQNPLNMTLVFILGLLLGVILITLATHTLPQKQQKTS